AGPPQAGRVRGVRDLPRRGAVLRLLRVGRLPVRHGATAGAWSPPPSRLQALVAGLNPSTPLERPVSETPIPIDDNARRIVVGRMLRPCMDEIKAVMETPDPFSPEAVARVVAVAKATIPELENPPTA